MYRVDMDGVLEPEGLRARARVRAPHAALVAIFDLPEGTLARWPLVAARGEDRLLLRDDGGASAADALDGWTSRPWYEWWVVGADERAVRRCCTWLSREVVRWVEAQPRSRELSDEGRRRLNALLAEGLSMDAALARAQAWREVAMEAAQFSWPIPGSGADAAQVRS